MMRRAGEMVDVWVEDDTPSFAPYLYAEETVTYRYWSGPARPGGSSHEESEQVLTVIRGLGTYLGRSVRLADPNLFSMIDFDLRRELIMAWLPTAASELAFRTLCHQLVPKSPLGILVAGPDVDRSFTFLLRSLDPSPSVPHIMTGVSHGSLWESLEQFLGATWPSEDRIAGRYGHLVIAESSEHSAIRAAARAILRE